MNNYEVKVAVLKQLKRTWSAQTVTILESIISDCISNTLHQVKQKNNIITYKDCENVQRLVDLLINTHGYSISARDITEADNTISKMYKSIEDATEDTSGHIHFQKPKK